MSNRELFQHSKPTQINIKTANKLGLEGPKLASIDDKDVQKVKKLMQKSCNLGLNQ